MVAVSEPTDTVPTRQPCVYIPHGGGPWPQLRLPTLPDAEARALAAYLRSLASVPTRRPEALLVISAHWETPRPTLNTGASPPMLYDYHGFPPEAYTLRWSAPGAPDLARRAGSLLAAAGLPVDEDPNRGFDHGVFLPLMFAWPRAELPTAQLSLVSNLDPTLHRAIGRALVPLRDEGVFIIGSGNSYHNLPAFFAADPRAARDAERFDAWLAETVTADRRTRAARLDAWHAAPAARACHPRPEHLLPLMVVDGAADGDPGRIAWSGSMGGKRISAVHFGEG